MQGFPRGKAARNAIGPLDDQLAAGRIRDLEGRRAGLEFPLGAFHGAAIGDRGQIVGREGEEVGPGHEGVQSGREGYRRIFSASQAASSPGVMAATCAPICTSRPATSRS